MEKLRLQILHDLKKVAHIINQLDLIKTQLDGAVGSLIGDLDKVVKGDKNAPDDAESHR